MSGKSEEITSNYRFIDEALLYPREEEPNEDNLISVCVIQCVRCGWKMFGDGGYESSTVNFTQGEQIPRYCAHCGAKFINEE